MRLFSTSGRRSRLGYFVHTLIAPFIFWVLAFILGFMAALIGMEGQAGGPPVVFILVIFGLLGAFMASQICITVQRLHDIDRAGTHWFLLLIPIYNIYLGLLLLFQKGTDGPNDFGLDPLGSTGVEDQFSAPPLNLSNNPIAAPQQLQGVTGEQ